MKCTITQRAEVGMKMEDIQRYSIARALRSQMSGGRLDGLEAEIHQELDGLAPNKAEGVWIPNDVLFCRGRRDLSVGSFGQGGALVQTEIPRTVIEILRNKSICFSLAPSIWTGCRATSQCRARPGPPHRRRWRRAASSRNPTRRLTRFR